MSEIKYGIEEVKQIGGKPHRLGFLLADLREWRPIDRILLRHRFTVALTRRPLFHYTSLAGFQGIVADAGFWASDNRFMNDTEEWAHGVSVVLRVIDHSIHRTAHPAFSNVLSEVRRRLEARPAEGNLIACFSLAEDSLEQWRGYSGSGGVCIEIGGGANAEGVRPAFYGPDMLPQRVVYNDRTKVILALQAIRLLQDEYRRDRMAMPDYWPSDQDDEYAKILTRKLLFLSALFKGRAFEREEEVRVVCSYETADRFGGVAFRPSLFGLVPYINTGKRQGLKGKFPIRKVIVGPSPHQDTILQSVRTFLSHNGYQETPVFPSRVPFRGC